MQQIYKEDILTTKYEQDKGIIYEKTTEKQKYNLTWKY